jgi:glycerate kinase
MKKSILVAPNAFKECADSVEAANIIKNFFNEDEYSISLVPLTDGGDGFLHVCSLKFGAQVVEINVPAPYGKKQIKVPFGINNDTVYIESARVTGLNLIPLIERKPLCLNTFGLGSLLEHISNNCREVKQVVIGIGGTGTNDLGIGAAAALGLKLFDKDNKELEPLPANYVNVKRIDYSDRKLPYVLKAVVDVDNKLLGEKGAARTFAKQKGASNDDINLMEEGFENICSILVNDGVISSADKLNGAGGGLAAGLRAFFNADLIFSEDFILNELGLGSVSQKIDIVITGEGRFDRQSLMNKAPGVIVNYFKNSQSEVFVVCGSAEKGIRTELPANIKIIEMQKYFASPEESIRRYREGIAKACEEIIHT